MVSQEALDQINAIFAEMLYGKRRKSSFIWWRIPKNWKGTRYAFGYTPWRTVDPATRKKGFFAMKYRVLRDGTMKLVKAVRFGRRKVARSRSLQWHEKYYGQA